MWAGDREQDKIARTGFECVTVAPELDVARQDEERLILDEDLVLSGAPSFALGRDGLRELLRHRPAPTAVFCVNDITAVGALSAAAGAVVTVPDQLSIIGFDDIEMAAWDTFSLTTISQPVQEMAAHAVRLLLDRIRHPQRPPDHVTVAPVLVARATTGPPPRGDSP